MKVIVNSSAGDKLQNTLPFNLCRVSFLKDFSYLKLISGYSQISLSRTLVSESRLPSHIKIHGLDIFSIFNKTYSSCYLKLLVSRSKFSETRTFSLRYQ